MKLRTALRSCFVVAAGMPAAGCVSDHTSSRIETTSTPAPLVAEVEQRCPACAPDISLARKHVVDRTDGGSTLRVRRSSHDLISAKIPTSSSGTMRVQAGAFSLGVRRVGATGSKVEWQGGVAAFSSAAPGLDALIYDDGEVIEELLVARSAETLMAYDLDLPRGAIAVSADPRTVVIRSGGLPSLRMAAATAWDAAGRKIAPRLEVQGNRVTVRLPDDVAWPVVVDPTWESTRYMQSKRVMHAAALLPSGKVLLAGGCSSYRCEETTAGADGGEVQTPTTIADAELFDPISGTFETTGSLKQARHSFTLTTLPSGQVAAIGGCLDGDACQQFVPEIELYDPTNGTFSKTTATSWRAEHTATRLKDGKVLIVGGSFDKTPPAEVFDPVTSLLTAVPDAGQRKRHTATPLVDGRVLIAGGINASGVLDTAELFDPASSAMLIGPHLTTARMEHVATLVFDDVRVGPDWLTGGVVLLTGGCTTSNCSGGPQGNAELFDIQKNKFWHLFLPPESVPPRRQHSSVLLADGRVLTMLGCKDSGTNGGCWSADLPDSADIFDPSAGLFFSTPIPIALRRHFTATTLASGRVLVAGGNGSGMAHRAAELFDPSGYDASQTSPLVVDPPAHEVAFAPGTAPTMAKPRTLHTATVLRDGRVLIAGGAECAELKFECLNPVSVSELYDFRTETVVPTGATTSARVGHRASLLQDGRVLLSGGCSTPGCQELGPVYDSLELYDPATGKFTKSAAVMSESRAGHTATVLPDGRVLFTGGCIATTCVSPPYRQSVDLYDPATDTLKALPPLSSPRAVHTATLLPSGKVLIVGGRDQAGSVAAAELVDPVAGSVTQIPRPFEARAGHAAVLMPGGSVFLAAGSGESGLTTLTKVAEYFDESGASSLLPLMKQGHFWVEQGGVRLLSGKIAMFAGNTLLTQLAEDSGGVDTDEERGVELFDPLAGFGTGAFAYARHLSVPLGGNTATRLPSGRVALIGGCNVDPAEKCIPGTVRKEIISYDDGMYRGAWRPTIDSSPVQFRIGQVAELKGTGFLGRPGGGAGNTSNSDSGHPVAVWFPDSGGPPVTGELVEWTDTSAKWRVPRTAERGTGWLHIVVQGVPSFGLSVVLQPAEQGEPCALGPECASGFCVDRVCCNNACTQPCMTCSAANKASGADGLCEPVAQDDDPDEDCPTDPVASCSRSGTCDGKGSCAMYAANMPCSTPSCAEGIETPASSCNGNGTCVPAAAKQCAPSRCDALGIACITACKSASDCVDGATCVDGACAMALEEGASCTSDPACKSGACVHGACCTVSRCTPYACSGAGCTATCHDDDECATGARCDIPTKRCKTGAACSDDKTAVGADGTPTNCAPFLCSEGLCITRCSATEQCVTGNVCDRTTGLCVTPQQAAAESPGCGCSTPGRSPSRSAALLLAAVCVALSRRRRRY